MRSTFIQQSSSTSYQLSSVYGENVGLLIYDQSYTATQGQWTQLPLNTASSVPGTYLQTNGNFFSPVLSPTNDFEAPDDGYTGNWIGELEWMYVINSEFAAPDSTIINFAFMIAPLNGTIPDGRECETYFISSPSPAVRSQICQSVGGTGMVPVYNGVITPTSTTFFPDSQWGVWVYYDGGPAEITTTDQSGKFLIRVRPFKR